MLARFRRLLPLCCSLALLSACEDDLLPPEPFPAVAVARVALRYAPAQVVQGRTLQLVAEAQAGPGLARIADYPLRWKSSDPAVASVSASGQLVARRAGRTTVTVQARDAAESVVVTVVAQGYRVTPLTVPGVDTVYPAALNDSGQVLLNTSSAWPRRRAFVWRGGSTVEITPPEGYAVGRKINNRGQVAGAVLGPDGALRPAVWAGGRWTLLQGLPETPTPAAGPVSSADAINDAGQVAGRCGQRCAFRWSAGTATRLEVTSDFIWVTVSGINARGDVVGSGTNNLGMSYGLLWQGSATAVQVGSGRPTAVASAVNDAGQLTVYTGDTAGRTGTCGRPGCGWVRDADGKQRFLPGEVLSVSDLDGRGNAVGTVWVGRAGGGFERRGALWTGGVLVDLTAVADNSWVVTEAGVIDASGRILGMGQNTATGAYGAVLLTPR